MARSTHNQQDRPPQQSQITLTEPGRTGGLREFMHVLAAILARIDKEYQHRVQSQAPEEGSATGEETS
jgi:hypothetical protein